MARTRSSIVRHFDKSSGKIGRDLSFTGSCSTRPVTVFANAFLFVAILLLCGPLEHCVNGPLPRGNNKKRIRLRHLTFFAQRSSKTFLRFSIELLRVGINLSPRACYDTKHARQIFSRPDSDALHQRCGRKSLARDEQDSRSGKAWSTNRLHARVVS